jgi:7,8-dihydroneopterin aldolase/epimerase/oxygenase
MDPVSSSTIRARAARAAAVNPSTLDYQRLSYPGGAAGLMDRIVLSGISCLAKVGVHDWEQELGCPCEVDLSIGFDLARAAQSDQLQDTLDYSAIHREVIQLAEGHHYRLLEKLAEEIACLVLGKPGVLDVRVLLKKAGILGLGGLKHAAVEITRKNH